MTTLYDVARACAERHGVTVEDMKSDRRSGSINFARIDFYNVAISFGHDRKQVAAFVNRSTSTLTHHINGGRKTSGAIRWNMKRTKRYYCQPTQYKWR